ncbi:MAG: response regulator [Alphaproteobacteria bacterium]|nr:response regulator [Alphaproteobacteria bacterium]
MAFLDKQTTERELKAERAGALYAAAIQTMRVGVLIRDMSISEHPIVFINDAFTNLTGYSLEDIHKNSTGFLFGAQTDQSAIRAFHKALQEGKALTQEILLYRKNGSPFWAEWFLTPMHDNENKLTYFVSLFYDISVQHQAQEDLMAAKFQAEHANAVKTNFLAMMSHEIRTPINGILGILYLLKDTKLDQEQRHLLEIATRSSDVLRGIINDILDFAKMEAGKVEIINEPFSLHSLLGEVAALGQTLVGQKHLDLTLEQALSLPDGVCGDAARLRQIFLNLLSNAIKFTEKGAITIRAAPAGSPKIRFEIEDTGIGISESDQSRLFLEFSQVERSFTRRFTGTGLGLAISRKLVTLMEGEIGVESRLGRGSLFWFTLPMREGEVAQPLQETKSQSHKLDLSAARILLVEDNDTNRLVVRRYLEKAGFSPDEAQDGEQALEMTQSTAYDVILMDVSMPVMDGLMAASRIRASKGPNKDTTIIALTAHAMEGDRQRCLAVGMNDYLEKPLAYDKLVAALERWLAVTIKDRPLQITAEEDSEIPLLDPQILQRMRDELGGSAVQEVTQSFLDDTPARLAAFESDHDMDAMRQAAHALKSSSASCGLIKLSRLMESLEIAATRKNKRTVATLLPLIKSAYATSTQTLRQERTRFI